MLLLFVSPKLAHAGTNLDGATWSDDFKTLTISQVVDAQALHAEIFSVPEKSTNLTVVAFQTGGGLSGDATSLFYEAGTQSALQKIEGTPDTAELTNMEELFYGCSKLAALDLSSWNTAQVSSQKNMFYGCKSLATLTLGASFIASADWGLPACAPQELPWYTKVGDEYVAAEPNVAEWQNAHQGVAHTYFGYEKPTPPEPTPPEPGWTLTDEGWKYVNPDGTFKTSEWAEIDGAWYYFKENSVREEGCWAWIEDAWYGFWWDGKMCTGWIWDADYSDYFYCDPSGRMVKGIWDFIDNAWYGFNWDGTMCRGWIWDGGYASWFYCYQSGVMAFNTWIDGYWLNASGAYGSGKTGWQNPAGYYQVSCWTYQLPCSLYEAQFYYVSPSRISANATKEQCIEAFLKRAQEYLGTPYRWDWSDAPGTGVDCVGLVYQCAYATGMNMGEFNPYDHWITGSNGYHSHDADNLWNYGKMLRLSFAERQPGDLIFWPGHVAIYMGNDQMIEAAWGNVHYASVYAYGAPLGIGRLFI